MKQNAEFFDEAYFERAQGSHKGNYTRVGGYRRHAGGINWDSIADTLIGLIEKPEDGPIYVLDVGCAYGFLVAALRRKGVDAYGIDISEYAIGQADPEVRPYLTVGDISEATPLPDSWPFGPVIDDDKPRLWDVICSFDVMEHCSSKAEAKRLLSSLALVTKLQYHKVNTGQYDWQAFGGDQSHGVAMPLKEWQKVAAKVEEDTGCKIVIVE